MQSGGQTARIPDAGVAALRARSWPVLARRRPSVLDREMLVLIDAVAQILAGLEMRHVLA